jgi:hypothetical protein
MKLLKDGASTSVSEKRSSFQTSIKTELSPPMRSWHGTVFGGHRKTGGYRLRKVAAPSVFRLLRFLCGPR